MGLLEKTEAKSASLGGGDARDAGGGAESAIDPNSGITPEEQREILAQIDGIAEKNRRALLEAGGAGQGSGGRFKAKKHGGLFPILVNVAMAAVLAAGFLALYVFQAGADAQAREGARVFNPAERALIAEIRRETGSLLEAADLEIARLLGPLADLERQLRELPAAAPGQAEEHARLTALHGEVYRELETARRERSRILDESRSREASIQAQLETRIREAAYEPPPAAAPEYAAGQEEAEIARAVAYASAELARLSDEQALSTVAEARITAFFESTHRQITEGSFDGAERTTAALREFIDSPALAYVRAVQARRDIYVRAVNALEALLEERRYAQADEPAQAGYSWVGLPAQTEPDGNGAGEAMAELLDANAELQGANAELQGTNAQLQSSNAQLAASVASLQSANASLAAQADSLRGDLDGQAQEAEYARLALRDENDGLMQELAALREQNDELYGQLLQIREAVRAMVQ